MWFAQTLFPDEGAYNMPVGLRIDGPLDVGALCRSLGKLVERHAILRTRCGHGADGELIQLIGDAADFTLSVVDIDVDASGRLRMRCTPARGRLLIALLIWLWKTRCERSFCGPQPIRIF
ncbi:condensation domain-containing protein [Mycobacteroides abscessus]|nr:condensation domain-containing protein [Mycobacteroides abscessus]